MRLFLLAALLIPSLASAQSVDTVRFSLDMIAALEAGWLQPQDATVGVRGDLAPLSWSATQVAADPDGDGVYELVVPFALDADSVRIAFKIKVDGGAAADEGWQAGRNHSALVRRGADNRIRLAWTDEPPPLEPTITGHVERIAEVEGQGVGARDVWVYLPPGYHASERRYPVLYLHDGQNVFDASSAGAEWSVDEAAEALIRAGEIEPLIVVGVASTVDRFYDYTPTEQVWRRALARVASGPGGVAVYADASGDTLRLRPGSDGYEARIPGSTFWQPLTTVDEGYFLPRAGLTFALEGDSLIATKPNEGGGANRYGDFLVETLKPLIDARYRTQPGAASTGLGGSSLGGLVTLHLGLRHADVFGKLIVASPSVWWDSRTILDSVCALDAPTEQRIWLDMGTEEGEQMLTDVRVLRDELSQVGWTPLTLRYIEDEGAAHTERAWAARVPDMLRWLFPPQ
jgi:predicted alpha/beta superfamily hydrolase